MPGWLSVLTVYRQGFGSTLRRQAPVPRIDAKPSEMCARLHCGFCWLRPAMHSQEECSTEIKFLLSPSSLQTVIAALSI